jgi:HAD superfamily hydrolase (TIGR01509 family)
VSQPPSGISADEPEVLLCDADGCLFASEGPAFQASAQVTNRLMQSLGSERRYDSEELRVATTGRNFRTTASDLAAELGHSLLGDELEWWVAEEKRVVTRHLARVLKPDEHVLGAVKRLARRYTLAAVSSSALERLEACFEATGLADLFPPHRRFSAEDSLPLPASKPDPAVYLWAGEALGVGPGQATAIEDSIPGVQSAVAAGYAVIGNVMFVEPDERAERTAALLAAGAVTVVSSWLALEPMLHGGRSRQPAQMVPASRIPTPS